MGTCGLADQLKETLSAFARKGVYHIFGSFVTTRAIDFALVILIARVLGPSDMGHLSVINSALAILAIVAAFGLPAAATKYVAETKDTGRQSSIFRASSRGALAISAAAALAAFCAFRFTGIIGDDVARGYLEVLVFIIPFLVFSELAVHYIWGRAEMKRKAAYDILIKLGYALLVAALIFPLRLKGVIAAKLVNPVLWATVLLIAIAPRLQRSDRPFEKKRLYRFGLFACLADLSSALIRNFDIIALSFFMKDAALIGAYRVAALLAVNLDIAFEAVVHTYYPDISRLTHDRAAMRRLFRRLVVWALLIMVPVCALAFAFAPAILRLLFGSDYLAASGAFRILVFAPLIYAVLRVFGNTFTGTGRPDLSLVIVLFAGASNIALNMALVPKLGITGAAAALVATHALNLVISSAIMYRYLFRK